MYPRIIKNYIFISPPPHTPHPQRCKWDWKETTIVLSYVSFHVQDGGAAEQVQDQLL